MVHVRRRVAGRVVAGMQVGQEEQRRHVWAPRLVTAVSAMSKSGLYSIGPFACGWDEQEDIAATENRGLAALTPTSCVGRPARVERSFQFTLVSDGRYAA